VVEAVYADWRTAPVAETTRAALGFLETLTLRPDELTGADIAALRAAGLDDQAIEDAALVCAGFNIIDRLADTFDFEVLDADGFATGAGFLLKFGYALPAPLRLGRGNR
jgi:alkylhydroperoxidase family enzyme